MGMYTHRFGQGAEIHLGLHGWSGNHTTFAPLSEFIPARASLYAVDLPGYGRSSPPPYWTLGGVAGEVAEWLRGIDAPRVTITGSCSGGIIGAAAARLVPEKVARLILIDPFAYLPAYFKPFLWRSIGWPAYALTFANPLGRWITNLSLRGHRDSKTDLTEAFQTVDHRVAHRYLKALAAGGSIQQLVDLNVPTEILHGEKTFQAVRDSVGILQGLWPHARIWTVRGAGHLPIDEAGEEVCRIVFDGTGSSAC